MGSGIKLFGVCQHFPQKGTAFGAFSSHCAFKLLLHLPCHVQPLIIKPSGICASSLAAESQRKPHVRVVHSSVCPPHITIALMREGSAGREECAVVWILVRFKRQGRAASQACTRDEQRGHSCRGKHCRRKPGRPAAGRHE